MEISYCSTTVRNIYLFFVDCVFYLETGLWAVRKTATNIIPGQPADIYLLFLSCVPARLDPLAWSNKNEYSRVAG